MQSVRLFSVVIATAAGMLSPWALMAAEPHSVALPESAHSLRVIVDPRVELMSVIFRLAGNPEYNRARVQTLLKREAHLEWFDAYFGQRPQASFTVALGLLNGGGNYGPHFRAADGREEFYCVLGVWKTDPQGLPAFTREVVDTVVHEFCHSYANGIITRHLPELSAAGQRLYAPVARQMRSQAYGTSQTLLYESLVRACTVGYVRRYAGEEAAQRAIEAEKARGFLWMQEMSDLLGQYEAHRAQYPTLEDFSPRLVAFFAESAKTYSRGRAEVRAPAPKSSP